MSWILQLCKWSDQEKNLFKAIYKLMPKPTTLPTWLYIYIKKKKRKKQKNIPLTHRWWVIAVLIETI